MQSKTRIPDPLVHLYQSPRDSTFDDAGRRLYISCTESFLDNTPVQGVCLHLLHQKQRQALILAGILKTQVHLHSKILYADILHIYFLDGYMQIPGPVEEPPIILTSDAARFLYLETTDVDLNFKEKGQVIVLDVDLFNDSLNRNGDIVVIQLSTFPSAAFISKLPDELLDNILEMAVAPRSSLVDPIFQMDQMHKRRETLTWHRCSKVCRHWHIRLRTLQFEPDFGREKLETLKKLEKLLNFPFPMRLWQSYKFTWEDANQKVNPVELFGYVRTFQKLVSRVELWCPPRKSEPQDILHGLAEYTTLESLILRSWSQQALLNFLEHTHSWHKLKYIDLDANPSTSPSIDECVMKAGKWNYNSLPLAQAWRPASLYWFSLRNFHITPLLLIMLDAPNLFHLQLDSCFPEVLDLSTPRPFIITLRLWFQKSEWFRGNSFWDFQLETPLDISNFRGLFELSIDGGHQNSNLIPLDFFACPQLRKIKHLRVQYCTVQATGFTDLIRTFSRQNGSIHCDLFYGDWGPADLALAQTVVKESLGHGAYFHLEEGAP
ncbi:hypothetical protein BT69DRAFT_1348457 [Atractiella rhizophila]|nr:hypothetical protein BT69DRAFT_1348457 [Atractiella rhizophila]